jgi:hypothetical protein
VTPHRGREKLLGPCCFRHRLPAMWGRSCGKSVRSGDALPRLNFFRAVVEWLPFARSSLKPMRFRVVRLRIENSLCFAILGL